jgi:formylglycine-generating enzyme required for sulfatase activity
MSAFKSRNPIGLAILCAFWASVAALSFGLAPGDVNGDGIVNLIDSAMIRDHLLERKSLTGAALTRADADGDGKVRMADLVYVNNHFYKPPVKGISGWIALPAGTPLSPTGMKIIAAGGEAAIDATWHFTGLPAWNTGCGQFVFVEDSAGSSTLMGYVDPSEVSTGTLILTPTHIALGLIAMHPACFNVDDRQRREILAIARSNPDFPTLVALITQALQTNPTHLADYNTFPQIYELAGAIGNAAADAWTDSEAPGAALGTQPGLFAQVGRSADPHLEDWLANGMTLVNPHLLFYGVNWGTASNQWTILRGKDGVVQLIPPAWAPDVRKNVTLANGNYTVNIYKGQGAFWSSDPTQRAAAQANVIKTILLGLDTLAPPGWNIGTGILNNNELIERITTNPSQDKDALVSMWVALNLSSGDDWFRTLKNIVEKLIVHGGVYDGSGMQKIAHLVYGMTDTDGRALWRYFKAANSWLDTLIEVVKIYDVLNEFVPYFVQVFFYQNQYVYSVGVNNGILSEGWKRIPPTVVLTASTATPRVNQSVAFDATGTTDDSDPLSNLYFRWDYDANGTWDTNWTKGVATSNHAYATVGRYCCIVEARDSQSLSAQASFWLNVQPQPGASISINVTPDAGSWRLVGPAGFATFTGTGDRTGGSAITNCPAGQYTLSCNDNVVGYNPPPPETKTLASGGTIAFTPNYVPESGPNEITINLPGNVPLVLVRVPAGSFQMGLPVGERSSEDWERPVHTVNIAYNFYMGKYELTQRQWLAVMGSWPHTAPHSYGVGDNYPAYYISWNDCQSFITALNTHITNTGQGLASFRLPSEAEWEYACRAGTQTRFFFGDSLSVGDTNEDGPAGTLPGNRSDYMWYWFNYNTPTYGSKQVGTKLPNQFGLYDMSGNVWEWCQDWYHTDYTGAPTDGSAWESPIGSNRVVRGGDWDLNAYFCRSADRFTFNPGNRYADLGFRLLRTQ